MVIKPVPLLIFFIIIVAINTDSKGICNYK